MQQAFLINDKFYLMRIAIIILSLIWLWFGTYLCKMNFCADTTAPKTESSTGLIGSTGDDCNSSLIIKDKVAGLDISSAENFQFKKSSGDLLPATSDMAGVISQLVDHLAANPNRFMQITGFYHESETNNTSEENLGLARATGVRAFLISKGIDPAQLTLESNMDNEACASEEKILKGVKVVFSNIQ